MLRVHENKTSSVHGRYVTNHMALNLVVDNTQAVGDMLRHKVEVFRESEEGTLVVSSDCKRPHSIRLDKEDGVYRVTFTNTVVIGKDDLAGIESLLLSVADKCSGTTAPAFAHASSSTNLLNKE
jgi:hypothetical protein